MFLEDQNGVRVVHNSGLCNLDKDYFDDLFKIKSSMCDPLILIFFIDNVNNVRNQ